jgi:site-specific recombinase XerD
VDFKRGLLTVRRSDWKGQTTAPKGGRIRHIPMTDRVSAALRAIRHLRAPRVICRDDGSKLRRQNIQKRVRRAARHAGLANVGVHVLRHTFCSHLAMRGAPARAIQELAGHKDLATAQRYMHLSPSATYDAIRLLEHGRRGEMLETATAAEGKVSG